MNAAFAKKGGPKRMAFLIQVQEMQWVGAIWHKTCAKKWNSITPPSVTHFWHLTYLGKDVCRNGRNTPKNCIF